jgi:uncharacterized protein (DUF934 family)
MNKEILLEVIKPHMQYVTTVMEWDVYAKEHGLPPSAKLIYNFDSWSNVKKALDLPLLKNTYTFSELEKIAKKYKKHFLRKSIWDKYSKEHGLPASSTFIIAFGSWQKVKEHIGLGNEKRKNDLYSKDDIKRILKKHAKHYINRTQWDEYAKEHKLPTYKTIKKHFEYDEILEIVNKKKTTSLTEDDLIKIALTYQEHFLHSSMKKWDMYAKENDLPASNAFHKMFGSWRKAKYEVAIRI